LSVADTGSRRASDSAARIHLMLFGLAGVGLLLGAFLVVLPLRWSHVFGDVLRTEAFVVGPIDPGSAVEQSFVNPTEFLTGLTVAARLKPEDREMKSLIFRLRAAGEGGELIREGRVELTHNLGTGTDLVRWSFAPVHGRSGEVLDVQISLDPAATVPIEFPVSQGDQIPGALRTNSIPTDEQFDLLLAPVRDIAGIDILRVVARDGIRLLILVGLVPVLWIVGLLSAYRYVPRTASMKIDGIALGSTIPAVPGLVAAVVAALLIAFAGGQAPEREPVFWVAGLSSGLLAASILGLLLSMRTLVNSLLRLAGAGGRRVAAVARRAVSIWPSAWLSRSRPVRAMTWLAAQIARAWSRLQLQTVGRLPARLRAPARLLLRTAVLLAGVVVAQIGLVSTYEDGRYFEKPLLDEQVEIGLDILYFGDSSLFYTAGADTDKRTIDQMLDTLLPDRRVVPVAQVAFHPGMYLDFARYLDRRGELPETVIVPIHVGVFYDSLLVGTPYDRQRIGLRFAETPREPFTRAWLVFSDFEDSLDRTREYVANSPGTSQYDLLRSDNPRLLQAVELAELLVARGVRPIFYVTPLNITPENLDLREDLRRVTGANAAFVRGKIEATGAIVLDLLDDLAPGSFSTPQQPLYPHMVQGGRAYIAERLAATIRANGRPE
jgi:hypothetical protein